MKTFEFTLKHDSGEVTIRTRAQNLAAAQQIVLTAENAPMSAIRSWRVVPTKKQTERTKSLLRGI